MDDLISRQAAIEAIDAVFPVDPMKSEYAQGIACGAALAKTYVEQLPSAQKKGHWKDECSCSVCNWIHEDDHGFVLLTDYNFCPNCGADMRGKQDD